jgi:hypothetical protein
MGLTASSSEITAWQARCEPRLSLCKEFPQHEIIRVHLRDLVGPHVSAGPQQHFGIKLKIEIQEKLEWDWSQVHWRQLAFSFVIEPGLNKIRGKDIALEQPIVIRLQCVEHFT